MVETQKFPQDPRRGQTAQVGLRVNEVLYDRYKITGVLGIGGMGAVYLARDLRFPNVTRYVAVKEMQNNHSDPQLRAQTYTQFEREIDILASLDHPVIPQIYDRFQIRDKAYLVMQYINGKDLEAILNQTADFLPYDMVVKWALELCDVLDFLHKQTPPIIFRDMKPSNVMIDSQGYVRLIDFGIAKRFEDDRLKGTQIGTEGYSPPEQYRGEATPQGDVFALGATLHHILTRRDPRLEQPFSFKDRVIHHINPKVPEAFTQIVMRAVSYNLAERFASAGEMKAAIEALSKPREIAVAVNSSAAKVEAGGASAPSAQTIAWSAESAEGGSQVVWRFTCEDEIYAAPAIHNKIVYVSSYDHNIYALDAINGAFRWKFATEAGIATTPVVAPDEGIVIIASEDHHLYGVSLKDGTQAWKFQAGGRIRSSPIVEHGRAFFGCDDGKLYAVRFSSSTARLQWSKDCGAPVRSRPVVYFDKLLVGTEGSEVLCFDLNSEMKWRFNKAKRQFFGSPTVQDDIAYVGSMDSQVYAIDMQSGFPLWRQRLGGPIVGSPLLVGKTLYVGATDGIMYALDINMNGREVWRFTTSGQIASSPVFANGAVYFGSSDGSIYSVDTKLGRQRWKFTTAGVVVAGGIISDNILYIGSNDHNLYALNT
ncbi:MAG: PQQ-binding-like beta-propeller repeat protein [Anaerolineae bacterium]